MKVDLLEGVVPITKAQSTLAMLIARAQKTGRPVIITQRGYPEAALVDVKDWTAIVEELEQLRARVAELEPVEELTR